MKVLMVTSVMPIRGGVTTWMNIIAEGLRRDGYEVKVINAASGKGDSVRVFVALITNAFAKLLSFDIVFFLAYLLIGMVIRCRIATELRNNCYDVVHAQDLNAFNAVYNLCKKKDCQLVLTVHGHFYNGGTSSRSIESHGWLSNYLFREERLAIQHARKIITVSVYSYNFIKELNPEARIELIRNFVDTNIFYPLRIGERERVREKLKFHKSDFVVLSVGRLAKGKGVYYILDALAESYNNLPVKLVVAGNGPEQAELLRIAKDKNVLQFVNFTGELSSKELLDYYNAADIFVIASVTGEGSLEGTPMSLLEAMACGLPVVATPVGGIVDVIQDGLNGIFIPEKDGAALATALRSLYDNQEFLKKLSGLALDTIQQDYCVDKVINKVVAIYQE